MVAITQWKVSHTRQSSQTTSLLLILVLTRARPKRVLEGIKGISEQKATKLLAEGKEHIRLGLDCG